ncbi:hypothetical protein ACFV5J_26445 [Streptomyces zaomyceticus]|uniref:hypothetical protein n=1 Tax=Streptomyces zaomyceticus TaxID=68286 RepID=UPI00365C80D1
METMPAEPYMLTPERITRAADYVELVWKEKRAGGAGPAGEVSRRGDELAILVGESGAMLLADHISGVPDDHAECGGPEEDARDEETGSRPPEGGVAADVGEVSGRELLRHPAVDALVLAPDATDESSQTTHDRVDDLRAYNLALLRTQPGPRGDDVAQSGVPGVRECHGQARREREDDAPVVFLASDDARLTGLEKFLEAATGQKAFPLHHGLFGIEVCRRRATRMPAPARTGGPGPLTCRPAPRKTSR